MKILAGRGVAAAWLALAVLLWARAEVVLAASGEQLVVLTWADYIDPEVVTAFERETGVEVRFRYFESDDARDEMMAEAEGRGFDIALVNGLMLDAYAARNWLAPVSEDRIPNLRHVDPVWRSAFPAAEGFAVPYFWGTLGIAYRADLVPAAITRWAEFFEPAPELHGRINLLKSSRDVVGMALKSLGFSANTGDREEVRAAGELLQAQKPFVRSYEYVSLTERSALVTGETWASMMYSGDAIMMQTYHEAIVYVVPEEGSNLWTDYLVVLESSPRKDLAARFVDYLNRPEVAASNALFVYYATPNTGARDLLPAEFLANPVIYPASAVLERSEAYRELAPRVQKTVNSTFSMLVN